MTARCVCLAVTLAAVVAGCAASTPSTRPTPVPGKDRTSAIASASAGTSTGPSDTPSFPTSAGNWSTGVSLPVRHAENAAVAVDGVIYLAGGLDIHGSSLDL